MPFTEVDVEGCCDVAMRLQGDRTTMMFTGTVRENTFSGKLREDLAEDGAGVLSTLLNWIRARE